MKVHTEAVGPFMTNAYVVGCEETRKALLIDPGGGGDKLMGIIARERYDLTAIVITHAHIDHVAGVGDAQNRADAPCLMHPAERALLDQLPVRAQWFGFGEITPPRRLQDIRAGEKITAGQLTFTILDTPGHSPAESRSTATGPPSSGTPSSAFSFRKHKHYLKPGL